MIRNTHHFNQFFKGLNLIPRANIFSMNGLDVNFTRPLVIAGPYGAGKVSHQILFTYTNVCNVQSSLIQQISLRHGELVQKVVPYKSSFIHEAHHLQGVDYQYIDNRNIDKEDWFLKEHETPLLREKQWEGESESACTHTQKLLSQIGVNDHVRA